MSMTLFPLHIPLPLFYYNYYCSWLFYVHHSKLKGKGSQEFCLGESGVQEFCFGESGVLRL